MPMTLAGSCHCGAVGFSLQSHTPYPYQRCYCSICRKTGGGGGYAINIMGLADSLQVKGARHKGIYHAIIRERDGSCRVSQGERHFCSRCASALWVHDEAWPELVHPFASAIDTPLPAPPAHTHVLLAFKAPWVELQQGPDDELFDLYPRQSIEDWHRSRKLWIE